MKIELYPELFARRGINVPGILMAALYGAGTDNSKLYRDVMQMAEAAGIEVEILQVDEPQMQRVTIEAAGGVVQVAAHNRGGGRLALKNAIPSREEALAVAKRLQIEVVD